jgi:hypothetical protein
MTLLPYVFVIDLDGTIVGRVDFQSQQFVLYNTLKQSGFKPVRQNKIPAAFYPNAKLVRPGLRQFMGALHEHYNGKAYFFVYTGSEKTWANQEISWIEKTHGIKFMRPIFTRDDCTVDNGGNVRKSLTKIWPRVTRALPAMTPKERTFVFEHQTIIIDNNAVFLDHTEKLLVCPTYNFSHLENMLHGIPQEARSHHNIDKLILSFINQGLLCPYIESSQNKNNSTDGMRKLSKQYAWLSAKCKSLADENEKYANDKFWSILKKLLVHNNIRSFPPSTVISLQTTIWKSMGL